MVGLLIFLLTSFSWLQSNSQGLYEKDLKRVRAKLESFFAEKESCDARVRDLEVNVDGLNSDAETLLEELAASSNRG